MPSGNPFEQEFKKFVRYFGGTVLEEAPRGRTADFLFSTYNTLVELKTLSEDKTQEINNKVSSFVADWIRENGHPPKGFMDGERYIVELRGVERPIAEKWLNLLRQAVDRLVKDANAQISETKQRERMPNARGILLIHNPLNRYHNDPKSFRLLVADALRKKDPRGNLRYPHIHGGVYFSTNDVQSPKEDMYFWANFQMQRTPNEDISDIVRFQKDLQQGWYRYIEEVMGIQVRQHSESAN
jgi:hypothetical protein